MARNEDFSVSGLLSQLSSNLTLSLNRPSVNNYRPHAKQLKFHSSNKDGRLYIGGNRSGKTVGGIVEDIWWLRGTHPYIETPRPPIHGRIVTVDFENGWELIIKPELLRWLPASDLINGSWEDSWSEKNKLLTLANGSKLDIMSYQQLTEKHAGTSRHFVHFDEEPPSTLFNENKMRLLDVEGHWWITMTPVEGMSWTHDQLYENSINGKNPLIDVIEVSMEENPYISESAIGAYLEGMDEDDKKARRHGQYVQVGGLILRSFDYDLHVIPEFIPPRDWVWVRSLDHGFNNPTAWLYHAISPQGKIVTFFEHYKSELTIEQHATVLKEYDKQFGKRPDRNVGDPAIRQRMANSGKSVLQEYAKLGIPIKPSNNDVKIGIDQLNRHLRSGNWFITANCHKLIWEIKRYKWKTRANRKLQEKHGKYDEPHKKDDHAIDSARYFLVGRTAPDITVPDDKKAQIRAQIISMLNPGQPARYRGLIDTNLKYTPRAYDDLNMLDQGYNVSPTEWTGVQDDFMGGIF